uniref:Beclin 1-associated autophagy-related key regulator n=1 Tax=Aceria tosichella TaxID=561515 RepID=A0A6G1SLD4_9ACAR
MGREEKGYPDRLVRPSSESQQQQQEYNRQGQRQGSSNQRIPVVNQRCESDLDDIEHVEELYPSSSSSSMGSSPPRDFDVGQAEDQQYMPILDEQDFVDDEHDNDDQEFGQNSASSASSLSLGETNHRQQHNDYNSSPVIFNEISSQPRETHYASGHSTKQPTTGNSSRVIRCPVCEKPMRTFYCAKCIQRGKFVTLDHNQQRTENSFSEIMIEYNYNNQRPRLTQQQRAQVDKVPETSSADNSKLMDEQLLQIKLRALARKTDALKTLISEQRAKLDETKMVLDKTRQQNEIEKKSHRARESKIELIKRYIASRRASVKKRHDAQASFLEELKQHASRRVYQLTQDVFPIEEVNLLDQQNCSFVNTETSPLLTFSDGSHHQIDQLTAYSIVEPWLPGNGDYSAYSLWVNDNKDQLQAPFDESPDKSSAFRIGAALAYTTQFVKNLANYLDVILPAKMELDAFNRELLNDAQFSYNVAKLNANVIHLCVSQGIDISLLQSQRTLKNLLLLFNLNLCDIGRKPLIELDGCDDIALKIESELANDLSLVREDFYDFSKFTEDDDVDDGVSDSEWEISESIVNPVELQMVEQSIQQNSYISRPLSFFSSFWTAPGT